MAMNFVTFNQDYSYLAVGEHPSGPIKGAECASSWPFTDVSQPPPKGSAYLRPIRSPRAMKQKKGILP
jgi:hypothetical protein